MLAARIVAAVADAAERWRDADFAPRVRATQAIAHRTGYTEPVIDYALDALFSSIDRSALTATIASELGALEALDRFVARPGRPEVTFRAVGPAAIVSSDTTIGVAIPAFVFALCAKASVTVKDREDHLVAAFAQTIAGERPELRPAMRVEPWPSTDPAVAQILGEAATVVAYGRSETLEIVRGSLRPDARFFGFGHRTSIAYVAREALADAAAATACARGLATDALLYDGEGCLSVHAAFVERGAAVDPATFAAIAARAFDAAAVEFPAGYAEPGAAVAAYARAAAFRAAQGVGASHPGRGGPHLVVFDPPLDEPPPMLRRTLALYPVDGPHDARALLERHRVALEAVATAVPGRPDVEEFAIESGASRLASLGALQRPALGGEHGGAGRILPFVRAIYR